MTLRLRGVRASLFFLAMLLAGAAVLVRAAAAPAAQAETCVYDAGTKAVTATIGSGPKGDARRLRRPAPVRRRGRTLRGGDDDQHGLDHDHGEAGSNETLILDHRGGFFGPGAAPESNLPEIEIATALGDATDRVVVYGTEGPDRWPPDRTASPRAPTATSTSRSRPARSCSRCTSSAATTTSTAVASPGPGFTSSGRSWSRAARATSLCCAAARSPTRSRAAPATTSCAARRRTTSSTAAPATTCSQAAARTTR